MYAVHTFSGVWYVLQICPSLFILRNRKMSILDGKGDERKEEERTNEVYSK